MSKKLGDWVKAQNITWYSNFLMIKYDNQRWVEHFHITHEIALQLTEKLRPLIEEKNTKYKVAIPICIRLTCSLYKLSHGIEYLQCNEMFTIGKSLVNMVLHKYVHVVNVMFKSQIKWPQGEELF
jgi:hypothetical protein